MQTRTLIERRANALERLRAWLASMGAAPANLPAHLPQLRELALLESLAYTLERLPRAAAPSPVAPSPASPASAQAKAGGAKPNFRLVSPPTTNGVRK